MIQAPKPLKYDQNVVRPSVFKYQGTQPRQDSSSQTQNVGGWNYNPTSVNGPQVLPSWMVGAISSWAPILQQQGAFSGQLEGQRQQSILEAISGLSAGNSQSQISLFANRARDQRLQDARANMPGAARLGDNYKQALNRDAMNKASGDTSNFMAQLLNPQAQSQNAQMAAQLASGGQAMPLLGQLLDLQGLHNSAMGTEYNRPQSSGGGLGGLLGGLAGMVLGGGKPWWLGGK